MNKDKIVLPGDLVGNANMPFMEGIFENKGTLRSSRFGTLLRTDQKLTVRSDNVALIPEIGQTIIGRIARLSPKYCAVDILAIEFSQLPKDTRCLGESFRGTIRIQDILPMEEKEVPIMYEAFRPTDLVRAKIIGIGEPAAGYLLSTGLAEDLGVIFAKSSSTCQPMVSIAWNEMQCPQSGIIEKRKCARPRL